MASNELYVNVKLHYNDIYALLRCHSVSSSFQTVYFRLYLNKGCNGRLNVLLLSFARAATAEVSSACIFFPLFNLSNEDRKEAEDNM